MASVIIAKNQTAGALPLDNISSPDGELPASPATVTLTLYNTVTEIQEDPQLSTYIDNDQVLLNVDGVDLTKSESQNVASVVVTSTDPAFASTTDTGGGAGNAGYLVALDSSGNLDGRDVGADGTAQDSHIADVANPHATDVANLGSGTVAELESVLTDGPLAQGTMARIGSSTFSTIQEMQDVFHSSGWGSGGTITDAGANTVDVALGTGFIRATTTQTSTLSYFDWAASAGVSVPSDSTRYIGVEYNAGSPQVVSKTSDSWTYTTDFPLGVVVNEGGTLHITNNPQAVGDHASFMIQRAYETMPIVRDERTGGLVLGETGTRNTTLSAGALWDRLNRFSISALDTSVADTFDRYYQDGVGGWTQEANQTQWPNTQYDDGTGTLATMSNNRHSNLWFYIELDGNLVMLYGQAQYTSLAQAELESPPTSTPDRITESGKLIARLTFVESGATSEEIASVWDTTFTAGAASDHGSLSGLTDDDHTQYSTLAGDGTRNAVTGTHDYSGGALILPTETAPTPTVEGQVSWDSDDNLLVVGDGATTRILVDTVATQTLTNKTLTTPTIGDFTNATHAHENASGGGQLDHGLALTGLSDDDHTQYILVDGTRAFTGVVGGVTPTASSHLTTKSYVDGLVTGLTWLPPVDVKGYIGTRTITEINALSPTDGDCVVAGSAGTPTATGSDPLAIGDIAEYQGSTLGWQIIVTNSGGFPPDGTRALVSEGTLYSPLTGGTDEGKVAEWDGTSLTSTLTSPADGDATLVKGEGSVNENKQYIFDGTVPSGTWVQFGGSGLAHSSLSDLSWTSSGHTGTASRIAYFDGAGATSYLQVGVDVQAWDTDLSAIAALTPSQGEILYYNGTAWTVLAVGTSGQVLTTNGAGADPTWETGSGSSDHSTLTNLSWTSSGHTGTAGSLAAFTTAGAASLVTGSIQGDVIYFDGTDWTRLAPGTSGQFLQTLGSGANPAWATPTGAGDVSGPGSSTDNALVRWDLATGTLIQDSTGWVLGDTGLLDGSGGALVIPQGTAPAPTTEGQVAWDTDDNILQVGDGASTISMIADNTAAGGDLSGTYPNPTVVDLTISGETQGDILYFNGTNWVRLAPGTAGEVLSTNGAGANPSWVSVSTGSAHFFASTFTSAKKPYIKVKDSTYTVIGEIVWMGTNNVDPLTEIHAIVGIGGGTSMSIRVYDATNAATIAELTGITSTTRIIQDLGALSNLSAAEAVWEIQILAVGGGEAQCSGIAGVF